MRSGRWRPRLKRWSTSGSTHSGDRCAEASVGGIARPRRWSAVAIQGSGHVASQPAYARSRWHFFLYCDHARSQSPIQYGGRYCLILIKKYYFTSFDRLTPIGSTIRASADLWQITAARHGSSASTWLAHAGLYLQNRIQSREPSPLPCTNYIADSISQIRYKF